MIFLYLHRRGNQVNSDGDLLCSNTNPGSQSILHCIDALVSEAGTFEISSDLHCLLGELPLNVFQQDSFRVLLQAKISQKLGISDSLLEVVVSRALNKVVFFSKF